jgi:transcriptional regulator EpsA
VSPDYEELSRALAAASSVNSHLDFYNWLQNAIRPFLPHETLVAAWGDFHSGVISYDVASTTPGMGARAMNGDLDPFTLSIYAEVNRSERDWVWLDDLEAIETEYCLSSDTDFYQELILRANSLLVYYMRDERQRCDCLYTFSIPENTTGFNPAILDLLMPHLDSALRRVKCLKPMTTTLSAVIDGGSVMLSVREREVLEWVSAGKSNEEIGAILGISHNTVKNHLKRIFSKMGVTARSQAVRSYLQSIPSFN